MSSTPLVTPGRDALAKSLSGIECPGLDWDHASDVFQDIYLGRADALIASGAVIDAVTLADEAAEDAFWREQEAGNTKRDRGGYYHDGFIDGYRALAAFLTERGEQHG